MIRYAVKRVLMIIPVFLGVLIIVFLISRFMPGDPVQNLLGTGYTQEQYDALYKQLGLDKPLLLQFWNYLVDVIVHFDLGTSWQSSMSVSSEIASRILPTVTLGLLGIAFTILTAIPLGILSATKQGSIIDHAITGISVFGASVPGFWLALMLMILFCLKLEWLPASGLTSWKHYILPVFCSSLMTAAGTARMTRSSMLEIIRSDYIRTARAKGVPESKVIFVHALRNVMIPVVTMLGGYLGVLIGGSVVIETIFSIPGMGQYLMAAINNRNYPGIMGVVVIIALFICIMNIVIDLIYAAIDPRVKAQFVRMGGRKKKAHTTGKGAAE